ncbi:MAG: efflux RND transporter permease subunit [Bacteroidota bacterium]
MNNLIQYFIKYPIAGNLLMVMIAIFGIFGLSSMRTTFFPENDFRTIVVQTTLLGASPEEIEEGIVAKIEDNLEGLTGVRRVTSVSSENSGRVAVEIERAYDTEQLLQDVKNAVDQINSFPVNMESPVIYKQESLTQAVDFAISGETDLRTLKSFGRDIKNDLLAMDGISKVSLSGFPAEEIVINIRENDLRRFNLTFNQVSQAVAAANLELSGGTIKSEREELLIRSRNKEYYAPELADIVVATAPDGRRVLLSEVADVTDSWAENPSRVYINGKPGVAVKVSNTTSENLLEIAEKVRSYIDEFNEKNDVIQAYIIVDGSIVLDERISLLTENGLVGFLLVVLLLAMFLQIRLAFWVAIAIPLSILGTFIIASLLGVSINALSLFGLILVIGILVDDGIVISENIYRHWEMGKKPLEAALDGTMEVLPAVLSAILTTIVVFSGFLFLAGITGDFFKDIAIVVILTLTFSLVEGAFILPAHVGHSKALNPDPSPPTGVLAFLTKIQNTLWGFMDFLKDRMYAPFLRFFMRNSILGLVIPVALLMISFSLVGGGFVKVSFFPVIEADFLSAKLKMPAGTREGITQKWLDHMENAVWEVNETLKKEQPGNKDLVTIISKTLGSAGGQNPNPTGGGGSTSYQGNLQINLLTSEERIFTAGQIADSIRKAIGVIPGADEFTVSSQTPFGKPVDIAIIGNDLDELAAAAEMFKDSLSAMADLRDVTDSNQEGIRELNITLKDKAELLGLNLQTVVAQVRQGFFGLEVQRLQRGEDEVKIWVRYALADRSSVSDLEDMRIRTSSGQTIPLREIANLDMGRGVISINRIDGKREVRVNADLASEDVSSQDVTNEIDTRIIPAVQAAYPSVSFSFEGQVRQNADTGESAGKVYPIIFILMIAIIMLTFRSVNQTLAVLLIIPFGMIGVLFGHFLMGKSISIILSGLGILALIGVMVNDALVLVSAHNTLIKEGKKFRDALYEAAVSRFRPIFLTSLTTIAGLGPLMFETSFQAQFLIPMAISIAFGLGAATLIILITLPSLLMLFNNYKVYTIWLWEGKKPDETSVEPALPGRRTNYVLWVGIFIGIVSIMVGINSLFG